MALKENDLIFLLGAGCSQQAGVPTAVGMISDIERFIKKEQGNKNRKFQEFEELYNYVKSAILYSEGIFGDFKVTLNIERFLNVLSKLEEKERNVIYPFIANWNDRLLDLAGKDFKSIVEFKRLIFNQLMQWVSLKNYKKNAGYYAQFYQFRREFQKPLRIFTLNYDLCLEKAKPDDINLELGFDEDNRWNSIRFEPDVNPETGVYLYKLHGSINWTREPKGNLIISDRIENEPEIIFGTDAKLEAIDPFLFYVHEFRKYLLQSKLIVTIGYGFNDSHINKLLKQALEDSTNRKIVSVLGVRNEINETKLSSLIDIASTSQIKIENVNAKEFLESKLTVAELSNYLGEPEADIF